MADSRNNFQYGDSNYDGFAGDTTFMNYAGGFAQGGYSFQTTRGTGLTPMENPTVLFEMLKGKNLTVNGGIEVKNEITIGNSANYVKLEYIDNVPVGYMESSSRALKIYHSAINFYSYMNAHPLVIKDFSYTATATSTTIATTIQLVFPMPEYIYVDITLNDVTLILPKINTNYGAVDPKTEIFRFKIRQVSGGGKSWHLQTYNVLNNPSGGGTIYNFENGSQGYSYSPEFWGMEVHYYLGNWYTNRLN